MGRTGLSTHNHILGSKIGPSQEGMSTLLHLKRSIVKSTDSLGQILYCESDAGPIPRALSYVVEGGSSDKPTWSSKGSPSRSVFEFPVFGPFPPWPRCAFLVNQESYLGFHSEALIIS